MGQAIGFAIALFICMMIGSCRSYPDITEDMMIHDTCFVDRYHRDSIFQKDSIYVHEYTKGDTVHVDRDRWVVMYRDKLTHDSIYIHKTDTIRTVKVEKVEKHLSALEQMKMHVGGICLWTIFFVLLIQLWRWYKGK